MARALAVSADVIGATTGIAPELAAIDPNLVTTMLRVAAHFVPLNAYGNTASDAHAALTAHLLALSPAGVAILGTVGQIASESDGPSSRSFATAAMSDELLSSTSYGQIYMALRRLARVGRGLVVVDPTTDPWVV